MSTQSIDPGLYYKAKDHYSGCQFVIPHQTAPYYHHTGLQSERSDQTERKENSLILHTSNQEENIVIPHLHALSTKQICTYNVNVYKERQFRNCLVPLGKILSKFTMIDLKVDLLG